MLAPASEDAIALPLHAVNAGTPETASDFRVSPGSGAAKVASPGEDTPKAPRAFADPLRLPALASGDDASQNLDVV